MIRILLAAVAVLALALGWSLWRAEVHKGDANAATRRAELAEAVADTLAEAIDAERAKAAELAEIGNQLEEDRTHAETVPAAVAADLRAGNIRLRREWQGCETQRLSDATAAAIERDALAASRDEAAGRIVRIGRDADDQLRACQAVILADRGKP